MTQKDQQIIDSNPGKMPIELLHAGLSKKGFDEIVAKSDAAAQAGLTSTRLRPDLSRVLSNNVNQPVVSGLKKVRIKPLGGGMGTEMTESAALKLMKRNPNKYKIV